MSGPREAYDRALPYLQMLGRSVSYVGEGEAARPNGAGRTTTSPLLMGLIKGFAVAIGAARRADVAG